MTFIKQRQENTKSRPEGGCINQNQKTLSPGETAYKPALLSSKKAKKKSGGDRDSRSKLN